MKNTLYTDSFDSPIGIINIAASHKGICMLEFDDENRLNKHHKDLLRHYSDVVEKGNKHIVQLKKQLQQYFNKSLQEFNVPFDLIGTDFQINVWKELLNIKYGSTRNYKEQSIAMGDLKAIRAVANANGQNKIAIVIPCHRVIGSNGSLTGFGGGLWRKKFLLDLESNQTDLFSI